jgi:cytosine/uracil/thiamine/allantoin permease
MLMADFFVLKGRRYRVQEFYVARGAYWFTGGVSIRAMVAWAAGIAAYHLANPSTLGAVIPAWQKLVPPTLGLAGGSLPSFAVAFLLTLVFGLGRRKNAALQEDMK